MEATNLELWQEYSRKYLDKYGERPTIRITNRNSLILAILDLETPHDDDDDDDDDDGTSFD